MAPYTEPIGGPGQLERGGEDAEASPSRHAAETFVGRVSRLRDDDRVAVAAARKAVVEDYHLKAVTAALDALAGRAEDYLELRRLVAGAHVPHVLVAEGGPALSADELRRWNEIARLVQHAIDDALIAFLTRDVLHPNHLRELYRSWSVLDDAPSRAPSVPEC